MTDEYNTIDRLSTEVQPEIEEQDESEETTETSTSVVVERAEKQRVAEEIEEWVDEIRRSARDVGLDPYHVNYWIVDNEEMNELITYNGFQKRYPHWRWGMKYDRQRKKNRYFGGKAYEIVNNDDPAHAFLQLSNSEIDQKSVIAHVEAHADFFKNNQWFRDSPNAAQMLSRHADRIEEIMSDPEIDRNEVESLIDTVLCITDTIDQTVTMLEADPVEVEEERETMMGEASSLRERIEDLDLQESIREQFFDEQWIELQEADNDREFYADVLGYIMRYGNRYDEDEESAREFKDWEVEIIRMLREEAYYFAPQKMTKVLNEGMASLFETAIMAWEDQANDDEFIEYADTHSMVLDAPGFNPYSFGRELLIHAENQANRREVAEKLLHVDSITPTNFHNRVDFEQIRTLLDHSDAYSPAKRHFSLSRPANRGYLERIDREELQEIYRYVVDYDRYDTIDEAIADVDYETGWRRLREIREIHIDATFIDEVFDEEFVEERNYFTWDRYDENTRVVSSTDPEDVKKKLLLQFSNMGKPTIVVEDGNYNNSGELLLAHKYNGVPLDVPEAGDVLERLADIWGRPVHLKTVDYIDDSERRDLENGEERGIRLWCGPGADDEPQYEVLDIGEVDYLMPNSDVDRYDTRPDDW